MSYWDSTTKTVIKFKTLPWGKKYPNWQMLDCGCCAGIQWGGDEPRECKRCDGSGVLALHRHSRVLAHYPGGPFVGQESIELYVGN